MPTYDLKCQDCGERFERFLRRLIRAEDRICPRCGSGRVSAGPGGGFVSLGRSSRSAGGGDACAGGFT